MIKNNFVAVDFETAQPPWRDTVFVCQVGIVVVENGTITERISRLVKPPGNKISKGCTDVHGIKPSMTKNEPTFDLLWPEIEHYFINTVLIAHNSNFDERVLWQNLEHYSIAPRGINKFIDTMKLYDTKVKNLGALCHGFGIELINHHDAMADAEATAKIYLNFLNLKQPDIELVNGYEKEPVTNFQHVFVQEADNKVLEQIKIVSEIDMNNILSPDIFKDKRVLNTGTLNIIEREQLKELVGEMGGKYTGSLSKSTDIVILGDYPGPKKVEQIVALQNEHGKLICMEETHLEQILTHINYGEKREH